MPTNPRSRTRTLSIALVIGALVGGAATAALASVTVYKNDFSSRAEVREISKSGGKKCKRKFKRKGKSGAMQAIVDRGPRECLFRAPVEGDGALPDHDLRVDGKVSKTVAKSVRKAAFLAAHVRAGGGGTGYALRVFPKTDRFELTRTPNGNRFPVRGTEAAIAGIGKLNSLRLVVTGAQVRARVNGREVAQVTDPDPGEVDGRKLRFALGNDRRSGKDVVGKFKKLTVGVPNP